MEINKNEDQGEDNSEFFVVGRIFRLFFLSSPWPSCPSSLPTYVLCPFPSCSPFTMSAFRIRLVY